MGLTLNLHSGRLFSAGMLTFSVIFVAGQRMTILNFHQQLKPSPNKNQPTAQVENFP